MLKWLGRCAALEPVAQMPPAPVVEVQVVIEHLLHRDHAGEEAPPELHPPQLAENGTLQPLDEPIGPRVPGFGPGVSHPQLPTGLIERSTVLIALVAEHALHRPSRPGVVGTTCRKNWAATSAENSVDRRATAYEQAASQAVYCQTLPTPFSLPI